MQAQGSHFVSKIAQLPRTLSGGPQTQLSLGQWIREKVHGDFLTNEYPAPHETLVEQAEAELDAVRLIYFMRKVQIVLIICR